MKLASLKNGRDGTLLVVSKDLTKAINAENIAATMQEALDNWSSAEPELNSLYKQLNNDELESFVFKPEDCDAPLPRSFHWADASAYVTHVELVRKARGADLPESFWSDPLMYMGASDAFIGSRDNVPVESEEWGIDFEAEVAVYTDDVPAGDLLLRFLRWTGFQFPGRARPGPQFCRATDRWFRHLLDRH